MEAYTNFKFGGNIPNAQIAHVFLTPHFWAEKSKNQGHMALLNFQNDDALLLAGSQLWRYCQEGPCIVVNILTQILFTFHFISGK